MNNLYLGLMSGTSMDGIDAALVRFHDAAIDILATHQHAYPEDLREALIGARANTGLRSPDQVPGLHDRVGQCFAAAATEILKRSSIDAESVAAIGSHGQTLRHAPEADPPYSLQIGNAELIAASTGITTIADFRRADIELGGQGAPLAPAFHEWLFRAPGRTRVVLNIGGIANITVLHGGEDETIGFDTGPGNTLLDDWSRLHTNAQFDENGEWAAGGRVIPELLSAFLGDQYFSMSPPKSTGFEYFNLDWLSNAGVARHDPRDVQATLSELTAASIAAAVRTSASDTSEVLICGGGVHNRDLVSRLESTLPGVAVESTATAGLDPDWVEAVAFAWLAMRNASGLPGNLPSVTGARRPAVLGQVHTPH